MTFHRYVSMGRVRTIAVVAMFSLQVSANAGETFDAEKIARLDTLIAEKFPWTGPTPGYSIIVDQGGETVYERHRGFADIDKRFLITRNTVFKIGSITKSYTALAILRLVEEGRIELDSPISAHLSGLDSPLADVTVRQLLTHTSGVANYTSLPGAMQVVMREQNSREDILSLFKDLPLEFDPGSAFGYSNSGYYLLGLLIEAATGDDFFEHVETHVLDALGLESTYVGDFPTSSANKAHGYFPSPGGFSGSPVLARLTPFSAGAFEATASDLVKFQRAVFHATAISDDLLSSVTNTGEFPSGHKHNYALGAHYVGVFHGRERVHHSGEIPGFTSQYEYFPDDDITIAVLINADGAPQSAHGLSIKIVREIFDIPQPDLSTAEVSQELLDAYAGQYKMSPFRTGLGDTIRVVVDGGVLQLQINHDDQNPALMPLLPRSDNEFGLPVDDETTLRFTTAGNTVTGMEFVTPTGVIPGVRLPAEPE